MGIVGRSLTLGPFSERSYGSKLVPGRHRFSFKLDPDAIMVTPWLQSANSHHSGNHQKRMVKSSGAYWVALLPSHIFG